MIQMNDKTSILQIIKLKKAYSSGLKGIYNVIRDISFTASIGEVIIIMGPSGAGKSTLMNLIAGLEEPTDGVVKINNNNIFNMSDDSRTDLRRDMLGIIFQFFELHQGFTCRETLELKLLIDKNDRSDIEGRVTTLLYEVGLEDNMNTKIDQLSRGEKQRVAFARALVNKPQIILADEPTGALDFETAIEIMTLLRQTAKKMNSLLIISTHDYNIPQDGDRVILLEDGKIMKDFPSISRIEFLHDCGMEDFVLEVSG